MNLFDFWGLSSSGITKDSHSKKNRDKKSWPYILAASLLGLGPAVLFLCLSLFWK